MAKKNKKLFDAAGEAAKKLEPKKTNSGSSGLPGGLSQAQYDAALRDERSRILSRTTTPQASRTTTAPVATTGSGRFGAMELDKIQRHAGVESTYFEDERKASERIKERSTSAMNRLANAKGPGQEMQVLHEMADERRRLNNANKLRDRSNQGAGKMSTYTNADGSTGYYYQRGKGEQAQLNATFNKNAVPSRVNGMMPQVIDAHNQSKRTNIDKGNYYTQESASTLKYDDGKRTEYFEVHGSGDDTYLVSVPEERYYQRVQLDSGVNPSTVTPLKRVEAAAEHGIKGAVHGLKSTIGSIKANTNEQERARDYAATHKDGNNLNRRRDMLMSSYGAAAATQSGNDVKANEYIKQEAVDDIMNERKQLEEQKKLDEMYQAYKAGASKPMQFAMDVADTTANMAPGMLSNFILPGSFIPEMAVQAYGNSYNQARINGASHDEAVLSGMQNAAVESLSEMMFAGGKTLGKMTGIKGIFRPGKEIEEASLGFIRSTAGKDVVRTVQKLGLAGAEEGAEELVAGIVEPLLDNLIYQHEDINSEWIQSMLHDAAYNALVGFASGGGFGTVDVAQSIRQGADIRAHADVANMINQGLAMPEDSKVYQIAKKLDVQYKAGESLGNLDVSDLSKAMQEQRSENQKKYNDKMRSVSRSLAAQGVVESNEDYVFRGDVEKDYAEGNISKEEYDYHVSHPLYKGVSFYDDAIKQLTEKTGQTEEEVAPVASSIARIFTGQANEEDLTRFSMINTAAREAFEEVSERATGRRITLPASNAATFDTLNNINADSRTVYAKLQNEADKDKSRARKVGKVLSDARIILGRNNKDANDAFREAIQSIPTEDLDAAREEFTFLWSLGGNANLADRSDLREIRVLPLEVQQKAVELGRETVDARYDEDTKRLKEAQEEKDAKEGKEKQKAKHNDIQQKLNDEEKELVTKSGMRRPLGRFQGRRKVRIILESNRTLAELDKQSGREPLDDYSGVNGWYSNGEIHINIEGTDPWSATLSHEFTHHLERYSPAEYRKLINFIKEEKTKNDPEAWQQMINEKMELYDRYDKALSDPDAAVREIVADMAAEFMNDEATVRSLFGYDESLARSVMNKLLRIINDMLDALKGAVVYRGGTQWDGMEDQLKKARQMWLDAAEAARENAGLDLGGDEKTFSLQAFVKDGRKLVVLDQYQDRFEGHDKSEYPRIAKDIINELFVGKVIGTDYKMFVNGRGRDEFANPSKYISGDPYEAKLRAAGELDNLLDAGFNFRNEEDGQDGHVHPDVIGGFDYFDAYFRFGERYWQGTINIKNNKYGKLFKDVTQIKEVTEDIMDSYGESPAFQFLRNSSIDTISEEEQSRNQNTQKEQDAVDFENNVVDSDKQFSISESQMDPGLVKRLNNEKKVKVYRAMQYIDGRLYPPMAAVVKGDLNGGTELGKWEQAEERPDLVVNENGKEYFVLNKGNGKSIKARYNPYIHTSLSPLNDQFSSAYARPNMVVVEGYVPESELTSGYKAEKAKDSVGETQWKAGPVAGKLGKIGKPRRVILSRYFKPERVIPDTEVAGMIADIMDGTGISIPANVVTPSLRAELEAAGVEIDYENVPKAFKDSRTQFSLAADQHKIIKANTAWQKYLDGMNRSDIKSFSQVYNNVPADEDPAVDVRYENLSKASSEGFIGIYSPEPFKQGGYVTTSRALAEDLADGNRVYYAEVEPERIAWKDALQGVYADTGVNETDGRDFLKPDDYVKIRKAIFNKWTELNPDDYDSNYVFTDKYCVFYDAWSADNYDIYKVLDIERDSVRVKEITDGIDRASGRTYPRVESLGSGERRYSGHNAVDGDRRNGRQDDGLARGEEGRGSELRDASAESTGVEQAAGPEVGDTTEDGTQFSLSSPVEQKRDLIAVHNLNEEDLMNTIRLGGFPMPSIAVTRANMGHSKYGTITLLFNKDTIDPKKSKANEIFGGDAYTPTFPSVERKINDQVVMRVRKRIEDILGADIYDLPFGLKDPGLDSINAADKLQYREPYDAYGDSDVFKIAYLQSEKGFDVAIPMKEGDLKGHGRDFWELIEDHMPEFTISDIYSSSMSDVMERYEPAVRNAMKAYYKAKYSGNDAKLGIQKALLAKYDKPIEYSEVLRIAEGVAAFREYGIKQVIDQDALSKILDERVDEDGYRQWIDGLFEGIIEKEGIRNNKDPYTPSGNRRSWEALHDPVTLENVVKSMKQQLSAGANGLFGSNPKGAAQKKYGSISEVRADKDRLRMLSDEEFGRLESEATDMLSNVCASIASHNQGKYYNPFGSILDTGEYIAEILNRTRDKASIKRSLEKDYNLEVTDEEMDDLMEAIDAIANLPTGYFEAKPRRAVGLDEIRTAVIPDTASAELKAALDQNGIEYREYTEGDEEDRKEKVNGAAVEKELQFSLASDRDREIADLQSKVERLQRDKRRTYGREASNADATRVARALLADTSSDFSLNQTIKAVKELFTMIKRGDDFADIYGYVQGIARSIADSSYDMVEIPGASDLADLRQRFLDARKSQGGSPLKILIPQNLIGDFDRVGGWKEFRAAHKGIVTLSVNSGESYDSFIEGIADEFGEQFNVEGDNSGIDTLISIIEAADSQEARHPVRKAYKDEDVEGVMPDDVDMGIMGGYRDTEVNEIIDRLLDDVADQVAPDLTFADRKAAEKDAAVRKATENERAKWEARRQEWVKNRDKRLAEMREDKKLAVEAARAKGNERLRKKAELYRHQRERARVRRADNESRKKSLARIYKTTQRLSQKLLKPTDSQHIPEKYRAAVAEMLGWLDFENARTDKWARKHGNVPSERILNLRKLREIYAGIATDKELFDYIEPDDQVYEWMQMLEDLDGQRLATLDAEQLRTVRHILDAVSWQVNNADKALTEGLKQSRAEMATELMDELEAQKGEKLSDGMLKKLIKADSTPVHFFDRLGLNTLKKLYKQLTLAQDRHIKNLADAQEYIEKNITSKWGNTAKIGNNSLIKKWTEESEKYKLENGKTVEMTGAQVMSLYALNKREQARKHLLGGGIVIAPTKVKRTLKGGVKEYLLNRELQKTRTELTYKDITSILSKMSKEQIDAAEAMLKYLKTTSEWGNETSMKLYGYRKFTEDNYFPIQSAKEFIAGSNLELQRDKKIKNQGMTKNVNEYANNPLVIDDFFEVTTAHINQMSQYNSFVPILEDFDRIYQYREYDPKKQKYHRSVKELIEQKHGRWAADYIETLLKNVNGNYGSEVADIQGFEKLLRNWKAAKIGLSIRVLAQQPTAVVRAFNEIDPKYFVGTPKRGSHKRMWEICPIAEWKHWGYSQTDIHRSMRDTMMGDKHLSDKLFFDMYGKADDLGWGAIFDAVERETKDFMKKGKLKFEYDSAEYRQHVNERFRHIVDRTQVVDSVLHRSQLMRSQNTLTKAMTAFMAEPTISVNTIMTAFTKAQEEARAGHKAAAAKAASRGVGVFVANAVAVSLMASLISAIRESYLPDDDDDDDEKELTKLQQILVDHGFEEGSFMYDWISGYFIEDFKDNINPLMMLPVTKDMLNMLQGYEAPNPMYQLPQSLIQNAQNMKKWIDEDGDTRYSGRYYIERAAESVAELFGVPAANIRKELIGIQNIYFRAISEKEYGDYLQDRWELNEDYKSNKNIFIDHYLNAKKAGHDESAKDIREQLLKSKVRDDEGNLVFTDEAIQKRAWSVYAPNFKDDVIAGRDVSKQEKDLKSVGITAEDIDDKKSKALVSSISDAVEMGDTDRLEDLYGVLEKYGYGEYDVDKKVKSAASDLMYDAIDLENYDEADRYINVITDVTGYTRDDVVSSITTHYMSSYYEAMDAGDSAGVNRVTSILGKYGVSSNTIREKEAEHYKDYYRQKAYMAYSSGNTAEAYRIATEYNQKYPGVYSKGVDGMIYGIQNLSDETIRRYNTSGKYAEWQLP